MLGFSVFLGDEFDEKKINYIKQMSQQGFTKIFTSLHIPEEDGGRVLENLKKLGQLAKELNLEVMADLSNDGLDRLKIDLTQVSSILKLKEMGITGIRMDYGIERKTIAFVSRTLTVGLNASTLTDEDVEILKSYQADFTQMELWHNYYPRRETGLAEEYFLRINQKWRTLGLKIIAFVPGDKNLRGPLHEGLPSLESHRGRLPLVSAVDLLERYYCDGVCVGDEGLTLRSQTQFENYSTGKKILLEVDVLDKTHEHLFLTTHTNRQDDARDVIRSQEARFKQIPLIQPSNNQERIRGSITLDNEKYLRYMGELQLTKVNLVADEKVNVVARVIEEDLVLIDCILPGYQFVLSERRKKND